MIPITATAPGTAAPSTANTAAKLTSPQTGRAKTSLFHHEEPKFTKIPENLTEHSFVTVATFVGLS